MQEGLGFLVNLSVSLVLALVLGFAAQRLRLSPIIGYLLAGIAVGPSTPGFVADPKMAHDFAEVGIILLIFGVGMHLNFNDLLAVRRIAIPGCVGQILVASYGDASQRNILKAAGGCIKPTTFWSPFPIYLLVQQ
jgi:CPA2 family monovalent cation:H+ antiporter-2